MRSSEAADKCFWTREDEVGGGGDSEDVEHDEVAEWQERLWTSSADGEEEEDDDDEREDVEEESEASDEVEDEADEAASGRRMGVEVREDCDATRCVVRRGWRCR